MKNKYFIVILAFFMVLLVPIRTNAITVENASSFISYNINILENEVTDTEGGKSSESNDYTDCDGSDNSLLGNVRNPESVAWLVQKIFDYVRIIAPILVIALSGIDFIGVIIKSDDDAMAKARKKLITRLILAVALFLLPTIIMFLLNVMGVTSDSICGIK